MKRRQVLMTLGAAAPCLGSSQNLKESSVDFENPYEDVNWDEWELIHSMSHQHQGTTDASRNLFVEMGYRHFAFSNYYPSAPTLHPDSFMEANPGVTWAPNAEQHSFTDSGLHFNAVGSQLATGYGRYPSSAVRKNAPIEFDFEGITVFDEFRPWEGVYRLDLTLAKVKESNADGAVASLTIRGARVCDRKNNFSDEGAVNKLAIPVGKKTIYLRANADVIGMTLDYDSADIAVTQCRLMQGTNRPWRDVFKAALDGESRNGKQTGGLFYPEGGGITLNHPTGKMAGYLEMLDFDERVLGIEVWNQLTSGFGSSRGFFQPMGDPPSHFYQLWDEILATGRRCWGFFVKDHNTYGRGRNVLLVPPLDGLSSAECEASLLRAYRKGSFFGSIAAIACNEDGVPMAPYDHSDFRFKRIDLRRDDAGRVVAVEVAVAGNDESLRPNIQIRFVTENGVALIIDQVKGEYVFPVDDGNSAMPAFVRVEAFAYPDTHEGGQPLNASMMAKLGVAEIAHLHDRYANRGTNFFGNPAELRTPIPIVDQIFSQPIRRVDG